MSFLKKPNNNTRLYLQVLGFQSDTYLRDVADLLEIPFFELPNISISPTDMINLQMPDNLRLGHRLERFFAFLIQQSQEYDILLENFQINHNRISLGEIDFILSNRLKKEIIHIELGGKLYLYDPSIKKPLERWIGPNRKDALVQKLEKLHTKQFPILFRKETKSLLSEKGIPLQTITQAVCFKARLYLPYSTRNRLPERVSASNIKGYYVTLQELLSFNLTDLSFFLPEKQDWIVDPCYGEIWYSFEEILPKIEHLLAHKQSPLVWLNRGDKNYESIFVVWW